MGPMMRPRPRVLHLLSDWKWTGPSEPIVNLCRQLRHRGLVAELACSQAPHDSMSALEQYARERRVELIGEFRLARGFHPVANFRDIRRLTEFIDAEEVQVVHCHTSHDHYIGSRAARRANNQPFVVRTNHTGVPLRPSRVNRWLLKGYTDGWVAFTETCRQEDVARFGIDPVLSVAVEGAVDLDRFNPKAQRRDVRAEFGLAPEHVVAVVVARVQKRRRFDVLLSALAAAMKEAPLLRAMIIGRGTQINKLAKQPAAALGIADKVIFTGYRTDDYPDCVAAADFEIYLVPGSDGSCRAVREAMALGKPIVASRRGLLSELVEDGRCGLVIDDTPENLAEAILRLTREGELRARLGQAAAAKAREKFDIERQADAICELYIRLAETG